jgi:hypothetical protein
MRRIRPAVTAIALAAVIPRLLGVYGVFFVSAQYTGLGLFESYRAFQSGSNVGNVVSLVAVLHVRAFTDDTVPHSGLVTFLIQSGSLAFVATVILTVANYVSAREPRVPAS